MEIVETEALDLRITLSKSSLRETFESAEIREVLNVPDA